MKYYLFKVFPSVGKPYFVLNNQYIGYIGFDSNRLRSILESQAKIKYKYQLYAESPFIPDGTETDKALHHLNCTSTRFDTKTLKVLLELCPVFKKSKSRTLYEVYYPNRNSSACYLREVTSKVQRKTIK